ncbi:50S ribosomal protein L24 [Pendulispora brunnea]|uniref:Large ribosomal subunit protein uL24 n=1 Tax=Pendulispora brunnea TaxID=2905690 RepID=A0ABZ2K7K9_9BACT
MAARLHTGDTVVVITGKDKGKKGKIARILREDNRVVVEGVNLVHRHTRPTPRNPNGGIIEREQPIHASNVMLVDPSTGKPTRVHFKTDDKGNKIRVAKSGEEIAAPKREKK